MVSTDLYMSQCILVMQKGKLAQINPIEGIFAETGRIEDTGEYRFSSADYNIYQLGVQTLPGVTIILNDNNSNVKVGQTGIFEINLSDLTPLKAQITFTNLLSILSEYTANAADLSITLPDVISSTNVTNNYCIIDVIYSKNQDTVGGE